MSGYRRRGTPFETGRQARPSSETPAGSEVIVVERHVRRSWSLPVFASFVCMAFVLVTAMPGTSTAEAEVRAPSVQQGSQSVVVAGEREALAGKPGYTVTERPQSTAPATGTPDPGTAQAIAFDMMASYGWGTEQYDCLVALWNRESHWNVYAHNPSSGAYGIPQAVPGDKMATAGADWQTNPKTQIIWGLGYIQGRYQTPCGAWDHSERKGWY